MMLVADAPGERLHGQTDVASREAEDASIDNREGVS